jgi:DNA/RNA endonuclease YhcR with UshA esterase domain
LALLYVAALRHPIPTVRIRAVTPTMNYAVIAIEGRVKYRPYAARDSNGVNYASIVLDDGTGTIAVFAGRSVAGRWAESESWPQRGDRVSAVGAVSLSAQGRLRLRLNSERQIRLVAGNEGATGERPAEEDPDREHP